MGVDVAEVEPGVLSVVCHSVRACHLQLKSVLFFHWGRSVALSYNVHCITPE